MLKYRNSVLPKLVAILLIVSLVIPCYANAAVIDTAQPYASNYLDSYTAYVCAMGSGKLQIWFTVVGDTTMDEIGTLSIRLYESSDNVNWTRVKTFSHENYSSMLATDDYVHSSYVSYSGTAGKYYKAYVCIWAGKNGLGDTRYIWTSSEKAT